MFFRTLVTRTEGRVVSSRLFEAEVSIRTTPHDKGVAIVLPIVLPKTNWADLETTSHGESEEPTARARE